MTTGRLVRTADDLQELANGIDGTGLIAYDTETDGLDWRVNKIVGHVVTLGPAPQESFYIPVRHETGFNWDPGRVNDMLRRHLFKPDKHLVLHNAQFDLQMMTNEELKHPGFIEDTMVNAALIDENQGSFSLAACCKAMRVQEKKGDRLYGHIGSKFGLEPNARATMGSFWRLAGDDPVAVDYATGDGTSTLQLRWVQQERIAFEELSKVWQVECELIPILHGMTRRGIRIHEPRLKELRGALEREIERAKSSFFPGFNERSPNDMIKLFTDAGITDFNRTPPSRTFPTGQPSFNEAWLSQTPLGQNVLKVRKLSNLCNSFVVPMLERHLYKGRVHSEYNQLKSDEYGTVTGRLSSSNPNLQQVPKRNKELGSLFRSIFIPDEGKWWASVDYSQCEPRLLAYYGGVRVLIEGYLADPPIDAHTAVTTAADLRLPDGTYDRESGKRLNQGLITGMGDRKAAATLGKSPEVAEEILRKYFASMPEIKVLQREASDRMRANGFLRSLLGRKARLDNPEYSYKGVNRLLQCGNADIIKLKMVEVNRYIMTGGGGHTGIDMLNNIHDDLAYQFDPDRPEYLEDCKSIMKACGPGDVINLTRKFNGREVTIPMEVEAGTGANWAEATYGRETVEKWFKHYGVKYEEGSRHSGRSGQGHSSAGGVRVQDVKPIHGVDPRPAAKASRPRGSIARSKGS